MIIVVFGLPGSGKSHFSQQLADYINAEYIHLDQISDRMNEPDKYDEKAQQYIYRHLIKEITEKLIFNSNVVVDGTFHEKSMRRMIRKKAVKLGQKAVFIEMKSSEPQMKKRLKKKRDFTESDFEVYEQIKENFEPYEKPHLILRPDRNKVEDLLDRTKRAIYG